MLKCLNSTPSPIPFPMSPYHKKSLIQPMSDRLISNLRIRRTGGRGPAIAKTVKMGVACVPRGNQTWSFKFCAGYIVESCKGLETSEIEGLVLGSQIDVKVIPATFFLPLFSTPPADYPLDIAFVSENSTQTNEVRTLIRRIAINGSADKEDDSRKLALRLASVTDKRSQSGLFVILAGIKDDSHRILLWKFPADESLRAHITKGSIRIELIESAFSKRAMYYKAAMFEGSAAETSFWKGKVEDNQAKYTMGEAAEFWIEDFLSARSVLTDVHGTRVVSKALRMLIDKTESADTKQGLVAAARVLRGRSGRQISLNDIANDYVPEESRADFLEATGPPEVAQQRFRLDRQILESQLRFKSIMLDSKFMVKGPLEEFDDAVTITPTGEDEEVEVSLKGRVTSESVKTR